MAAAASSPLSATATWPAMSACTLNTSSSAASKGRSHRPTVAPLFTTSTSSGRTCTPVPPAGPDPAHRAGEEVADPELPGDVLERLRGAAILRRAGPRDHLEVGEARQLAAHLVGDPVGEVRFARISQVFERQHGEEHRPVGGRARLALPPGEEHSDAEEKAEAEHGEERDPPAATR